MCTSVVLMKYISPIEASLKNVSHSSFYIMNWSCDSNAKFPANFIKKICTSYIFIFKDFNSTMYHLTSSSNKC